MTSRPGSDPAAGPDERLKVPPVRPMKGACRQTPEPGRRARRRGGRTAAADLEPYDFRRPTKLSREHARALQVVAETFARQWATQFSTMLRDGQVEPGSVTQTTYGKYVAGLPAPSLLAVISLRGAVGLRPAPRARPGHGRRGPAPRRARRGRPARAPGHPAGGRACCAACSTASSPSCPTPSRRWARSPRRVAGLETNPQFAQVVGPSEALVVIDFGVTVGDVSGSATLAIPYAALQPHAQPRGAATSAPRCGPTPPPSRACPRSP